MIAFASLAHFIIRALACQTGVLCTQLLLPPLLPILQYPVLPSTWVVPPNYRAGKRAPSVYSGRGIEACCRTVIRDYAQLAI